MCPVNGTCWLGPSRGRLRCGSTIHGGEQTGEQCASGKVKSQDWCELPPIFRAISQAILEGLFRWCRPAPFHLPAPLLTVNEKCSDGGGTFSGKCLRIWRPADFLLDALGHRAGIAAVGEIEGRLLTTGPARITRAMVTSREAA